MDKKEKSEPTLENKLRLEARLTDEMIGTSSEKDINWGQVAKIAEEYFKNG